MYPNATRLLITADAGGSNGYRLRLWKLELQKLADETGLEIAVCHFPPGTSKWNKIEHRLFSAITQNWRGKPLISHEVVVNLIGATTTTTGLRVKSELDTNQYPAGRSVSDDELSVIHLRRDVFHGDWNYALLPALGCSEMTGYYVTASYAIHGTYCEGTPLRAMCSRRAAPMPGSAWRCT